MIGQYSVGRAGAAPRLGQEEVVVTRRVVGPVDVTVMAFTDPDSGPALAAAVEEAVESRAMRVLDALWIRKGDDGEITVIDVDDEQEAERLLGFETDLPGLFGEEDVSDIAASMPNGSASAVIAWENIWASRLSEAVVAAGGVQLGHDRIPPGAVDDLLDLLDLPADGGRG